MIPRITIPAAVVAFALACNTDSSVAPSSQDELVGTWISAGSDVSIGLTTTARTAMVKATFNADSTYIIEITDSASHVVRHAGSWSSSAGRQMTRSITLVEASPSPGVEEGVFVVNGARLTYEVTPVSPGESRWIQRFWSAEIDMLTPPCDPNDSLSVVSRRPCDGHKWTADAQKRSQQ